MDILIAVAGKHGSTKEIGEAMADEVRRAGHEAIVFDLTSSPALEAYDVASHDAVIVGSAIYMGAWVAEARRFVEVHQAALRARPVWLFSSGPLGDVSPQPQPAEPSHLPELLRTSGARTHRTFVGKLERARLSWFERMITRVVGAPYGDFRNWEDIRGWARQIATELGEEPVQV